MNRRDFIKQISAMFAGLFGVKFASDMEEYTESPSRIIGKTYFIDEANGSPNNSGLSPDDAYSSLGDYIASSETRTGDVVYVVDGKIRPAIYSQSDFPIGIVVKGVKKDEMATVLKRGHVSGFETPSEDYYL